MQDLIYVNQAWQSYMNPFSRAQLGHQGISESLED